MPRDPALHEGNPLAEHGPAQQHAGSAVTGSGRGAEYRGDRGTITPQRAQEIVRRAYLSVLNREPDAASQGYVDRVLRDKWTEEDVARDLRRSPEYRNQRR